MRSVFEYILLALGSRGVLIVIIIVVIIVAMIMTAPTNKEFEND
jgi:hypothetical protein